MTKIALERGTEGVSLIDSHSPSLPPKSRVRTVRKGRYGTFRTYSLGSNRGYGQYLLPYLLPYPYFGRTFRTYLRLKTCKAQGVAREHF
jgi:hypothetical protein